MPPASIYDRLLEIAETHPTKLALVDQAHEISYSALLEHLQQKVAISQSLCTSQDRVGLLLPNSIDLALFLLALPLTGCSVMPLDSTINERNLTDYLQFGQVKVLITNKKFQPIVASLSDIRVFYIEDLDTSLPINKQGSIRQQISELNPNRACYTFLTSGSSGTPKGVLLSQANLFASANNIIDFMGISEDIVESIPMPLTHSFGFARLRVALQAGGTAIIENGLLFMNKVFANFKKYQANALSMVPSGYQLMLTTYKPFFETIAASIRYAELGSAAMDKSFKQQLLALCPQATICMHYGSTEASRSVFINFRNDQAHLDSIGKATPNVRVTLRDENGNEITAPEVAGELHVSGPTVAAGYWQNSSLTQEKFVYNGYLMGDYAAYDEQGYLYLKAKKEDVMNIGGYNVSPLEIESVIKQFPSILDAAVVEKTTNGQSEIIAYIVQDKVVDLTSLKSACVSELESYKVPHEFRVVESLPKTWAGKIEKYKLKEM